MCSILIIIRTIINDQAPIIIDHNRAAYLHIRMISEWSCNTEDRSNDTENSIWSKQLNYIWKYIYEENSYFKLK